MQHTLSWLFILVLATFTFAAPAPSLTLTSSQTTSTVRYASNDPNYPLWGPESDYMPEPIRGSTGGKVLGPQNIPMDRQNPDALAPPSTDNGDV